MIIITLAAAICSGASNQIARHKVRDRWRCQKRTYAVFPPSPSIRHRWW